MLSSWHIDREIYATEGPLAPTLRTIADCILQRYSSFTNSSLAILAPIDRTHDQEFFRLNMQTTTEASLLAAALRSGPESRPGSRELSDFAEALFQQIHPGAVFLPESAADRPAILLAGAHKTRGSEPQTAHNTLELQKIIKAAEGKIAAKANTKPEDGAPTSIAEVSSRFNTPPSRGGHFARYWQTLSELE